jgi:hypothetical protein
MKTPLILIAIFTSSLNLGAQTLQNGDFDASSEGSQNTHFGGWDYSPSENFGGWTVDPTSSGANISQIGMLGSNALAFENYYDPPIPSRTSGVFQIVSNLTPGNQYQLRFYTSGTTGFLEFPVEVNVFASVDTTEMNYLFDVSGVSLNPWVFRTMDFIATAPSAIITFKGTNGPFGASLVDSVSVVAIPEPSSFATICSSSLLMFSIFRRKQSRTPQA